MGRADQIRTLVIKRTILCTTLLTLLLFLWCDLCYGMVVLYVGTPKPQPKWRWPMRLNLVRPALGMKPLRVLNANLSLGWSREFRQTFFAHSEVEVVLVNVTRKGSRRKCLSVRTKAWNGQRDIGNGPPRPVISFALSLSPTLRRVITSAASASLRPPLSFLNPQLYILDPARPPRGHIFEP